MGPSKSDCSGPVGACPDVVRSYRVVLVVGGRVFKVAGYARALLYGLWRVAPGLRPPIVAECKIQA